MTDTMPVTETMPDALASDLDFELAASEARALYMLTRPRRPEIPRLLEPSASWWVALAMVG